MAMDTGQVHEDGDQKDGKDKGRRIVKICKTAYCEFSKIQKPPHFSRWFKIYQNRSKTNILLHANQR